MKKVTDGGTGQSPQKNPLWVSLHPATLGGDFLLWVSRLFPKWMFVGLKGKPS